MSDYRDIMDRFRLADGNLLVIQRIRRKYTCYIVDNADILSPPQYLVRDVSLREARVAFADAIRDDVLELSL